MTAHGWCARDAWYRYPGATGEALAGAELVAGPGEMVAILGPNGAGKSTLLRLLLGALEPHRGAAEYEGVAAARWAPVERARRIGVLPQHEEPAFPVSVGELVAMGRYPHLGRWRRPGASDRAAVRSALERCRIDDLAARPFATLSGGERQRARLARALAQEPEALALDEPTASLDVAHEMEIWEILREEAARGRAVLLTTHHLNLAARYADRLVLLHCGRVTAAGRPADVLVAETVSAVYGWPIRVERLDDPGADRGAPQMIPLRPSPGRVHPQPPIQETR
ncbi:MAG TPA: ABC transporter ATP-binding protein [Candidatus Nanopelagicales bacterium]|nr:ABC transporter ATP-binding protein [Candidatus Nanopelagicales bacterium]